MANAAVSTLHRALAEVAGGIVVAPEPADAPSGTVNVVVGDSSNAPYTGPSGGSKTTLTVGAAVRVAAEDAIRQLKALNARQQIRFPLVLLEMVGVDSFEEIQLRPLVIARDVLRAGQIENGRSG